ncbi:MAG TPA: hypothetical protein VF194_11640 [Ferrovibrio sp.]|uniref:hypothetical protein n=1 Tax=Ferrovibrio sp. TaxID=1917215 RepID=UPI002ED44C07
MLRHHALAVAAAFLLAFAAPAAAQQARDGGAAAFVAGVEDLPLMPGLSQIETASTVFDAPSGRIVEAYAAGPVTREQVLAFYAETLPQLGWTADRPARFRREGEELHLEFLDGDEGELTVRFSLSPS